MNVLLVQPIKSTKQTLNLMPHLGLGYLATSIRKEHNVKILDCVKERFGLPEFRQYIKDNRPDVVGFTVFSCDLENVKISIAAVKEVDPEIITVAGGPHISGDPAAAFTHLGMLDYAFAGEAEQGFPVFLNRLSKGIDSKGLDGIPGLVRQEDGRIFSNPQVFPEDLDVLGFPSWDLLRPDTYRGIPNGVFTKQFPFAPIIVTRGCPYPCTFCAAHRTVGRKIRHRSIENVIAEITLLYERYGIREIHIEDDNFTFNIDFAKELCRRLIGLNLPLTYSCPPGVRIDRIDREILGLMKKAGFYNVYVGIESGSPKILKHMKKKLELEEIGRKVNMIKETGLETSGYFILGYPEETIQDMKMTIEFARSLNLDWAQFAAFIPVSGSEIMEDAYVREAARNIKWSSFYNTEVPFSPKGISRKRLKNMQRYAFLRFYLRPKKIINLFRKIRGDNIALIIKRVFSYLV